MTSPSPRQQALHQPGRLAEVHLAGLALLERGHDPPMSLTLWAPVALNDLAIAAFASASDICFGR